MRSALLALLFLTATARADFALTGGLAAGGSWDVLDDGVTAVEASWLPDERHWDLSLGYVAELDRWDVSRLGTLRVERVMRLGELLPLNLYLGLGALARTASRNADEVLPTAVSFSLTAGLDLGPVRVQWRHASNGNFVQPNRGINWLLVGVTF
jgi:hypothetical protein